MEKNMKCLNRQFGEIEYMEDHVFTFPEGIIGFERLRKFIVINDADAEPFRWLVSLEDEDISLPILDPKFVEPLYGISNRFAEGTTVAVVASLKEQVEQSTINMRSPLVFDAVQRIGKQVILDNELYGIQQRFIAEQQLVTGE
jgi:flagellar assembly factor FliW